MSLFNRMALRRHLLLSYTIAVTGSLAAWPAVADPVGIDQTAQTGDLPTIVVGATRLPTPQDQVGTDVTVITADDIARKQERTLPEVLNDVPGLNVVQTGSPGGSTQVYMRGTNANHTKVLIDGIEVSDPSSADGAFDFSQILASDIERVEVLRGPQSGLYGSDAIGGVINIITKKGEGPARMTGSVEGGSYGTFNQTAGISGSRARFNYQADFTHYRSDATQVTPTNLLPPGVPLNKDAYDNKTYATKLGANLTDNFDVGLIGRYIASDLLSTSDDPFGAGPEPLQTDSTNRQLFTRGFGHLLLFDGRFDQTAGVAYTDYRREALDPNANALASGNDPAYYRGDRIEFDWQGNIKVIDGQTVVIGAEHQRDTINDSVPATGSQSTDAGFAELQSNFGFGLSNTASVRYDSNSQFGGKTTYRLAPAYSLSQTDTIFRGSVGTGFKAPTLDQLYDSLPAFSFFANPNLVPETSFGWDAGVEQVLLDKQVDLGATYFHNDIKNLIDFNSTFTTLINVGNATTEGIETFASYKPIDVLTLRVDYTYTIARNDVTTQELARRPRHKAGFNASWQVTDKFAVTSSVVYTGAWIDTNRAGTVSRLTASPYATVNLTGSYDLGHGVTAFGRIDNLLDRTYQDPIGFQQQGLGVFAGVRVALDVAVVKDLATGAAR